MFIQEWDDMVGGQEFEEGSQEGSGKRKEGRKLSVLFQLKTYKITLRKTRKEKIKENSKNLLLLNLYQQNYENNIL